MKGGGWGGFRGLRAGKARWAGGGRQNLPKVVVSNDYFEIFRNPAGFAEKTVGLVFYPGPFLFSGWVDPYGSLSLVFLFWAKARGFFITFHFRSSTPLFFFIFPNPEGNPLPLKGFPLQPLPGLGLGRKTGTHRFYATAAAGSSLL